jgi:hypothetical protein
MGENTVALRDDADQARRLLELSGLDVGTLGDQIERMTKDNPHIFGFTGIARNPEFASHAGLTFQLEEINRRSALFDFTQDRFAAPSATEFATIADFVRNDTSQILLSNQPGSAVLASGMAVQFPLFGTLSIAEDAWASKLQEQMEAVQTPWLHPQLSALSLEGFATFSRLGLAVHKAEPFDWHARKQIEEDLGEPVSVDQDSDPEEQDQAHIDAGMNASLFAIAPSAVGEVMIQTGFIVRPSLAPIPLATDGSHSGHSYNPGHGLLITAVEQNLRSTINNEMTSAYGSSWIQLRIGSDLSREWQEKREKAIAHGESPLPLVNYSNFMDLNDIIINRQHWREVFERVFHSKAQFIRSMERLHSVRLPLSHSRPIGTAQQIVLLSEATIVLRAMGIDMYS